MRLSGTVDLKFGGALFKRAIRESDDRLFECVEEATLAVHEEAVRGIYKRSMGNPYISNGKKRIAAKIGEPPNVQTSSFVKSVKFETDRASKTGVVGTNDKRGPIFEFGTKYYPDWHPWLGRAWKASQRKIKDIFRKMRFDLD